MDWCPVLFFLSLFLAAYSAAANFRAASWYRRYTRESAERIRTIREIQERLGGRVVLEPDED